MSDFAKVSLICTAVVAVGIWGHGIVASPRGKGPIWLKLRVIRLLFGSAGTLLPWRARTLVGWLARLAAVVIVLSTAVLAATGLAAVFQGQRLGGYLLLVHVTAGPVLVVALTFWVLVRAAGHTFRREDWQSIRARLPGGSWLVAESEFPGPVAKACFWTMAVLVLPLGLSIVLSMFRLFDTDTLLFMEQVHRYSALAFCLIGVVYVYLVARDRVFRESHPKLER